MVLGSKYRRCVSWARWSRSFKGSAKRSRISRRVQFERMSAADAAASPSAVAMAVIDLPSMQRCRGLFDRVIGAVQILCADAIGRQQVDDGPERPDQKSALEEERPEARTLRCAIALFRFPERDGGDGATSARPRQPGMMSQARQPLAMNGLDGGEADSCFGRPQEVERCQRRCAAERIGREGVAVRKGALEIAAEESLVDLLAADRCSQRQEAAREALGKADEIGRHVRLETG